MPIPTTTNDLGAASLIIAILSLAYEIGKDLTKKFCDPNQTAAETANAGDHNNSTPRTVDPQPNQRDALVIFVIP